MKKLSYLILITLVGTSLFACGGDESNASSDDIMMQVVQSDATIADEPSAQLVESDVVEVTCGENDYTEGGALVVSCLDTNGESQLEVYLTCDAGSIGVYIDDENNGYVGGICAKVFCLEDGEYAEVNSCD